MLTTADIRKVVESYGTAREHLMLVLRDLQAMSGDNHLSTEVLKGVAQEMRLPESIVAGFVGFYSMFSVRPRARHVIRVCKSGPCHVVGASTIFRILSERFGLQPGTATPDGEFFLEACECLGVCSVAPAMMVDYDLHGNLTEERLVSILDGYRGKAASTGEQCGEETAGKAIVVNAPYPRRLLARVGHIDPTSIDSGIAAGNYSALKTVLSGMTPDQVVALVKESGLRGRGGAGFPAGVKWSFVDRKAPRRFVVCNADEGEPGTFKDRVLMEEDPHSVIEGMAICGFAIGATLGYIYVRGEYRRSIVRLEEAIRQARQRGWLGDRIQGTDFSFDLLIKEGGGAYVCGEETSLINSMEGRRGYPRFKPPFPGVAGFKNLPSNVNNVETFANVPIIVQHGAREYRSIGTANSFGPKLYCMAGHLRNPGLIEAPMGTTLVQLIETCGGLKEGSSFQFAQIGGSAGAIVGPADLELGMDFDQPLKKGLTLGSGSILVCDQSVCIVDFLRNVLSFFRHESCGQCVPCRVGTRQLYQLMDRIASGSGTPEDVEAMTTTAQIMKKASFCALGQSPIVPLQTALARFRDKLLDHCNPAHPCPVCSTGRGASKPLTAH